jgi:L-asparaginase
VFIQYLYFYPAFRKMQKTSSIVVVLGTGGTIAGTAANAGDNLGYTAAQLGVDALVRAVPALAALSIESEQVAQVDSKDMDFAVWRTLAGRVAHHLARPEVAGIVITHGTDTLEETAYLLQRVLAPAKPVVLTAAMRPATSLQADGPQNLLDAVHVARHPGASGVVAVLAGTVHAAADVRKAHTYRIDAFSSGDAGPVARVEEGQLRMLRAWPDGDALGVERLAAAPWPRVDIVLSHAGADGDVVDAVVKLGARGVVVAGTGNGTLHHQLEAALLRAQDAGVRVMRCSRVAVGPVFAKPGEQLPAGGDLSPVKARVELLLQLLGKAA